MRSGAKQGNLKRRVRVKGVKREDGQPVKVKRKIGGGFEFTVGVQHPAPGSARGNKRRKFAARAWADEEARISAERDARARELALLYGHGS